jgi:hypothetical protein
MSKSERVDEIAPLVAGVARLGAGALRAAGSAVKSYAKQKAMERLAEGDLHKKDSDLTPQSHDLKGKTPKKELKKNKKDIKKKIKGGGSKVFYAREGGVGGTPTEKYAKKTAKRTGRDFEAGSVEHPEMDPDVPGNKAHKQLKRKYGSALANLSRHATTGQGKLSRRAKKLARRLGVDTSNQEGLHKAAYAKSDFAAKQESPVEKAQQFINRQRRIGQRSVIRQKKKQGSTVVGAMGSSHFAESIINTYATMAFALSEEGLRAWFGNSRSKGGKPGWVQVVSGKPCARQPGQKSTPKCVSSSKRASMTPAQRKSAQARKRKADPNQRFKSGAAKPTYVPTDKPKRKNK